jgi:site-specific recombinase XerD
MVMMTTLPEIHITSETKLLPAIRSWELYLADQGRSHFTVKAFIGDLNLFSNYFEPETSIGNITMNDINKFLNWLEKERGVPCSPKSLSRRITSVKSFFRWLTQTGRLSTDPAEKVLQQSVISPLPLVLTPEEELKVITAATAHRTAAKSDPRPYTLLVLLLTTGIKKGECLAMNLNHIDLEDANNPILFVRYASPSNRFKERKITLTHDWVEVYSEYLLKYSPQEQVFPWSPRRLEYLLEDLGKEAGLDKHLSFDMCRWTSALNDWQSSIDRETLRQKLGISKIQWREISTKLRQLAGEK